MFKCARAWVAGCVLSLSLIGCTKQPASETPDDRQLYQRRCALNLKNKALLECYDYFSQVNRSGFRLPIVIIKAPKDADQAVASNPVVYLAGGPGATHVTHNDSIAYWLEGSQGADLSRDLVLFDLRGAAPGEPNWDCKLYEEISKAELRKASSIDDESKAIYPVLESCIKKFDDRFRNVVSSDAARFSGAGLAQFSTPANAGDVRAFMRHLGYENFSIIASSYGTRLAMELAVSGPEVERLVLDSPYPPGRGDVSDEVSVWSGAFENLFDRFSQDALNEAFWQAIGQLKNQPVRVRVTNWYTRAVASWQLTATRFAGVIYHAMYSGNLHRQIPIAVTNFIGGDQEALQPLLESYYNNAFDPYFNSMVYIATECNDNRVVNLGRFSQTLESVPQWQPFFALDWELDICRSDLFRNRRPLAPREWLQPTLIASGQLDPITNGDYAKDTLTLAGNGVLIEIADMAHAEFLDDGCGRTTAVKFLNSVTPLSEAHWVDQFHSCHLKEPVHWQR